MSMSSSRISSDERWRSSIVTSRSRRVAPGASRARRAPRAAAAVIEAGGDHGHPDLVAQRVVDHGAEDDVGVGVGGALDDLGRLVDLEQAEVVAAGDVEQDAGRALDRLLEQRRGDRDLGRLGGAVLAARRCRCPSARVPASCMIVRTSAKSRLIRPGIVIRSVMPWTPWRRTLSASRKASRIVVRRSTIASSFSLGITISVSTSSRSRWMPSCGLARALGALEVERPRDARRRSARRSRSWRSRRSPARRRCRCRRPRRR